MGAIRINGASMMRGNHNRLKPLSAEQEEVVAQVAFTFKANSLQSGFADTDLPFATDSGRKGEEKQGYVFVAIDPVFAPATEK